MAEEDEESGPVVELGAGEPVEGAPLARITSRLHYAIPKSDVVQREGDAVIRTPDGPRELSDILEESDETYFPREQDLTSAVRSVIGTGPVPTDNTDEA
ncbi:DUF5789 family protein [Halocatena pleomorpha]|uniref:Uncharacterized protein n=1 Tax=Halocatena pleomorpha TaxID=1785090 RepID=A0A3P3R5V2_9EURY|nr:DUF5789 family protein [Halocatena pleomorpha]RRJ28871.1 hypothetical protein EIK79_14225 [Halocatena pleomorpha]